MKEENYKGYIATEYEGAGFSPYYRDDDQISLHLRMLDKLWNEQ